MPAPLPLPVFSLFFALPVIAFWLWMFSDMMRQDDLPGGPSARQYWTLGFIFLSLFTAAYYYVYVYRARR